jgi:small subunit ribosomal protein S1
VSFGDKARAHPRDQQAREAHPLGLEAPVTPEKIKDEHPVGSILKGKITHFTKFGAFVEVHPGVEGLLHTSDISWTKKIIDPAKVLTVGQEIDLRVLSIDAASHKISLGLKQMGANPYNSLRDKMEKGEIVTGVVRSITDFGVFVDLGDDIEGLVHISNLAEGRVEKVEDAVKIGDEVKARSSRSTRRKRRSASIGQIS